ncbi:hypothetical protein FISHEDRAFT_41755 [Fistulina hepatica ATCC 64428]|nr:hypothetical protein FISHEDRAFT_41755 [Fistulina hepatica ATCC 64428]
MFDPLNSTSSIFGGTDSVDERPPWPTTAHDPGSPVPGLRRAPSSNPATPDKGPTPGLYGKEPQIYGQPEAGLISPHETTASNGTRFEKPEPYLRVRITALDRNRRDVLIRFDAQTNLANFTGTTYRNVSRSYSEFQEFYNAIVLSNPQTIVPALPLAQTSAPTDEEDDRLVKIMLQRWFTRICEDKILLADEDMRTFVESDFGYQPVPRTRRKPAQSFFGRRAVPDEDEELQRARFELTKLEGQFFETAKAIDKLSLARKSLAGAHVDMGNKLVNVAITEAHPPLANALRKIGRAWHSLADLDQAQAISESVIVGDSFGYQGLNARSAKETLQMRTGVLEEYQSAVKATISKKRQIERLKASSNIRADRVDEALEEMDEAEKYEGILARRAEGISQNLHRALQTYNRFANDDITTALIEHARSSIMYERQLLRELEALRVDVAGANAKVVPYANGVPRPTIIPPLEDFSRPPLQTAPPMRAANGLASPNLQPQSPPYSTPAYASTSSNVAEPHVPPSPSSTLAIYPQQDSSSSVTPSPQTMTATATANSDPLLSPSLSTNRTQTSNGPLLVGSLSAAGPSQAGRVLPSDPLLGASLSASMPAAVRPATNDLDPLGQVKVPNMSASVRLPSGRQRLDAREAASKLANMF